MRQGGDNDSRGRKERSGTGSRAGRVLGAVAHRPLRIRRAVVERQIAAAFPDRPAEWVRRVAADCYRHFGEELAATLRTLREGPGRLLERVENAPEPGETWRRYVPEGSGGVIVTGHLGNWELAGAFLAAAGWKVTAVARRGRAGKAERWIAGLRARLGTEIVSMEEAPRRLRSALEAGRAVALVADQHADVRGVPIPFLGRPASTFLGPARLALRTGVPLFFGALVREGARYRALLVPVFAPGSPGAHPGPEELTRAWVRCLEEEVRRRPEQYFWFHRRWKPVPGSPGRPKGRPGADPLNDRDAGSVPGREPPAVGTPAGSSR